MILIFLGAVILFALASFGTPQSGGFASSEVQFSDTSVRGMQIVPASCPSSPHWAGECGGTPPEPWQAGCTISVDPSGITAGSAGTGGGSAGGFGDRGGTPGESAVLSWDTLTRVGYTPIGSISNGIGPVARQGSVSVSPSQTTIYTYSGTYNARSFGGVLIPVATFSCSTSLLVYSGPTPCGGYFCTGTKLYYRRSVGRTCVNELVSECLYGCSVDRVNQAPVGAGGFDRGGSNTNGCLPPPAPTGSLSARPLLVRAGSTSNITWSANFVNSCTVTGTNGDRWTTMTGNETSGPITQQTIYTLSCEGVDGSTLTQRVIVNIIPIFQEASAARAYSAAADAPLAQAQAQSNDELKTTIRAALLADPRSASLSEAEMEAMVSALAEKAQMQGVTSSDIAWRPQSSESSDRGWWNMSACGNPSGFLCALSTAFGFAGPDPIIAIALGVLAAILLFVVGSLIEIHRRRRASGAVQSSAAADSLYS